MVLVAAFVVVEQGNGAAADDVVDNGNGDDDVVGNGTIPSDEATSDSFIFACAIVSFKKTIIAFLNSTFSNFKSKYRVLTYTVFATGADGDSNGNADALVTKVSASTDTTDYFDNGDDSKDAIVATEANVESDSNAINFGIQFSLCLR